MGRFVVRRLLTVIPVALLVTMIAFGVLFLLPGDAALAMLGAGEQQVDPVQAERLRHELGLDRPVVVQYAAWLGRVLHGDLGRSFRTKQTVASMIVQRVPITLELGLLGMLTAVLIGIPAGIISAIRPGSARDQAGTLVSLGAASLPNFWLAILLIYLFSVYLKWLPPSGYVSPTVDLARNLRLMIMPTIVVSLGFGATLMRQTRGSMIEVLRNDYITTARSKGLRERTIVIGHGLKNAMIPIVTILGMHTGRLLGGSVIAETIFSIPGVGLLFLDGLHFRDFPVVQGVILVLALSILISNLLADFLYAYLDPRIRYH